MKKKSKKDKILLEIKEIMKSINNTCEKIDGSIGRIEGTLDRIERGHKIDSIIESKIP